MLDTDAWILIQIIVDIILFSILALYILRSWKEDEIVEEEEEPPPAPPVNPTNNGSKEAMDVTKLESMLVEFSVLLAHAEEAAERIENASKFASDTVHDEAGKTQPITNINYVLENKIKRQASAAIGKNGAKDGKYAYTDAAKLIWAGMKDEEIARIVGLPIIEVKLIRNMAE